MDPKRLLLLLGILVVLLGIVFFGGAIERGSSTIKIPTLDIPVEEVVGLTIVTSEDSLVLTKTGAHWMLTHPVESLSDSVTVSRFLQDLGEMELESEASQNPDRYALFGVDAASATVVTVDWGEGTEQITVGSQGADFQSVFVRLKDDSRVFATRGSLSLPPDIDRWRDKTILDISSANIMLVAVQRPEGSFEMQRSPDGWEIDGTPADSISAANWLRRFEPMRADGFFDDLVPDILEEATYELTLQTMAGTTEVIRMVDYEEALAVTSTNNPVTFRLLNSRLASFFPEPESLQ